MDPCLPSHTGLGIGQEAGMRVGGVTEESSVA